MSQLIACHYRSASQVLGLFTSRKDRKDSVEIRVWFLLPQKCFDGFLVFRLINFIFARVFGCLLFLELLVYEQLCEVTLFAKLFKIRYELRIVFAVRGEALLININTIISLQLIPNEQLFNNLFRSLGRFNIKFELRTRYWIVWHDYSFDGVYYDIIQNCFKAWRIIVNHLLFKVRSVNFKILVTLLL